MSNGAPAFVTLLPASCVYMAKLMSYWPFSIITRSKPLNISLIFIIIFSQLLHDNTGSDRRLICPYNLHNLKFSIGKSFYGTQNLIPPIFYNCLL